MRGRLSSDRVWPAGIDGIAARMVRLASGTSVRVVETGPLHGDAVLCIHGWAANAFSFRHLLPALATAGFRAVAVDLKGHGWSDKPLGAHEYSDGALRDHVLEIMDALGMAHAALVAHSMGGVISLDVAVAAPPRVDALALLAPAGLATIAGLGALRLGSPAFARPLLPFLVPRWLVGGVLRWAYGSRVRPTVETVEQYWAQSASPGYAIVARDLVHGYRWTPFSRDVLGHLMVPTLIVLGSEDRLIVSAEVSRLAGALPRVRVEVIPGAGHLVAEEAPEEVNALVLDHLRRVEGARVAGASSTV